MRLQNLRGLPAGALAVAALLLAACGDGASPSGPGAQPKLEVVNPAVYATALQRDVPLDHDITVSARISDAGGLITIKEAGLRLFVPHGAVRGKPMVITATALKGNMVAYEFGPHGSTFAVPLQVFQELKGTNWWRLPSTAKPEAAYFADVSQLDYANQDILVNEFLPVDVDIFGANLRFGVRHFSGYAVASGRKQLDDDVLQ